MPEIENAVPRRDWSYEIISFVVLTILSALSHFWYVLIVFAAALLMREFVGASLRYFMDSLRLVPWHPWNAHGHARAAHPRHQVFKPSKIG